MVKWRVGEEPPDFWWKVEKRFPEPGSLQHLVIMEQLIRMNILTSDVHIY